MEKLVTLELVDKCVNGSPWDVGNKVLYDLCSKHFTHRNKEDIIAKVWLIGRAYSVALERRKNKKKGETNELFYTNKVVSIFRHSELDKRLTKLKKTRKSKQIQTLVLQTHNYLTGLLQKKTNQKNRSFASKYLHFHLPSMVFIYDARANKALRKMKVEPSKELNRLIEILPKVDKLYSKFVIKCLTVVDWIDKKHGRRISPRQLDNLLLEIAAQLKI